MKSFEDYIIEYPNVIGSDLCNDIITKFDSDDRKYQGRSSAGVFLDVKDSIDLPISALEDWDDIDGQIYESTTKYFSDYIKDYLSWTNNNPPCILNDCGYQIQKTTPGGQYIWHHDALLSPLIGTDYVTNAGFNKQWVRERIFTFILYLNDRIDGQDSENGRTQFYNSGISKSVVPEKGKLLLFPANTFWTHRGEPLTTGVKYLLTGWCSGYFATEPSTPSSDDMNAIKGFTEQQSKL